MKKLNVAVLGQGRSGRNIHVKALTTMPALQERYRVAMVCDPLAERVESARKEFGCDGATDWRAVLARKDIDLVVNATPSNDHVPVTKELLDAGHNVLCEKPFARLVSEVDMMVAAAKKSGRMLAIFQQAHFMPYFQQVQSVLASGVLGRVVQIKIASNHFGRRWDWQTIQKFDGGNLRNMGPHSIDQALKLFGDADPQVFCRMDRAVTFGDAEDHVKLLLYGKDRPTIDIEISSCFPFQGYNYQIYATCGGLTGTAQKIEWKWFDPAKAPKQVLIKEPLPGLASCSEELPWQTGSWELPAADKNYFDVAAGHFYTDLYASLTEGKPLAITPAQVRRQIVIIEECTRQSPMPVQYGKA